MCICESVCVCHVLVCLCVSVCVCHVCVCVCLCMCVLCKLGTQIEMQSAELNRILVHVTMFVSESVCTIIRQVHCLPHV